jgi:hypothetical protein
MAGQPHFRVNGKKSEQNRVLEKSIYEITNKTHHCIFDHIGDARHPLYTDRDGGGHPPDAHHGQHVWPGQ